MFCDKVTKNKTKDCRNAPQGIHRIEEIYPTVCLTAIKKLFNIVTVFCSVPGCY
jgi:hypothetical protein